MRLILIILFLLPIGASAKEVLFFGDSQSYSYFGSDFAQELEKIDSPCHADEQVKNHINLFAVSGSSPRHWGDPKFHKLKGGWLCERKWKTYETGQPTVFSKVDKLCDAAKASRQSLVEKLVELNNPEMVVFQFLGNSVFLVKKADQMGEAGKAWLDKHLTANLKGMLDPIGQRECLFVTSPPHYHTLKIGNKWRALLQLNIKKILARDYPHCRFIEGVSDESLNTLAMDKKNFTSDKKHLSKRGGKLFSDYLAKRLCPLDNL